MAHSVVQVDLSDQAADFRKLALQPGMGLIDKSGAHTAILRKWLGSALTVPRWEGNIVYYQIQADDGAHLAPKRFEMLTAAECKGAFRPQLEAIVQKLESAPARTGTERALRHVMLDRLKKYQTNPAQAAQAGVFGKYLDPSGVWQLVWLWGYERKTTEPGTPTICKKPHCHTLAVLTEDRRTCPACGAKLSAPRRSPTPILAALLLLVLIGGGLGYYFTRPPAETPLGRAALNGQVLSVAGQRPVSGAIVRVPGSESQVQTDAEGMFELKEIPLTKDPTKLVITAPGFLEQQIAVDPQTQGRNPLMIPLRGATTVEGQVRDQASNTPIAGATVSLPTWDVSVETDAEGRFQIADVPAGKMSIEIAKPGYGPATLEETLTADAGGILNVQLAGQGKLVGRVIDALSPEKPIPGAQVYLLNTPLSTTTDANGRFEIPGIPTGTVTIAVQAEGYQTESSDQELKATEIRPFPVGLHGAATLRGRVLNQATGQPMPGATVQLLHPQLNREPLHTNDQGEFEFRRLPPGQQAVKVSSAGFEDASADVVAKEEPETIEIALTGTAKLTGTVKDASEKKPIPNAEIQIKGTELAAKTDEQGQYEISGIPGGDATVQIVGRGYRQQERPQTFEVGKAALLDVELKGGTILSGLVMDELSNRPIAKAQVQLVGSTQKTETDNEGRFRFEDVVAGPKSLSINADGYQPTEQKTELKTDEEAALEIGLQGDAVLVGKVVSAVDETPIQGANVQLADGSREAQTDAKGEFRLENVPSGLKDITVSQDGYQTANVSRTMASGEETNVEVVLRGAAQLTGTVTTEAGRPLVGANIRVAENSLGAVSGEDGKFQVEGLTPGDVKLKVSAKGFFPEERTEKLHLENVTSLGEISLRAKPLEEQADLARPFTVATPEGRIVIDETARVDVGALIPRDDFRLRLERANAKTGDVQISMSWDNINDIDLHVQAPSGEVIYFRNRHSQCGGELDVDMNANWFGRTDEPIENIYWPLQTAPRGKYKVLAHHYANHGAADPTAFRIAVKNDNEVKYYSGKLNPNEKILVCEFERLTGPEAVPITGAGVDPMVVVANGENGSTANEGSDVKVVPVYNRTEEEQANHRLKLAQELLALGKTDAAKRWLEDVVEQFPNTSCCKKAQKLLDELAGSGSNDTTVGSGVYLADLTPTQKNVGGTLQPRKVRIRGEEKHHSLWTRTSIPNPPASVQYALGRKYLRLSGAVGIDDSGSADRTRVSTQFTIVGDGKKLWSSDYLREPGKIETFEVDVSQVNTLKILAHSNGTPSHYPVWVEPWLSGLRGKD